MEYCKSHLDKAGKARTAGTTVLLVLGGLFTALWLFLTVSLTGAEDATPAIFLIAAVILLLPGGVMLFCGIRQLRWSGTSRNPENSGLVRSIRRQLPAEQAELSLNEIFAVVDRDLRGGQEFGKDVVIGHEWVLIGDFAVQISRIRGIFLRIQANRTPHTYVSSHQLKVYDDAREAGEAVFLMDGDAALDCLKALGAAAPWAVHGGMEEEVKFLSIPAEQFRRWNEELALRQTKD